MADLFGNEDSTRKPPFIAYKTLTNFIDQFQDSTLPSHIDKSFMAKMSGSNQVYLINSLKYLGLISEDNAPEEPFLGLVKAGEKEKATIWREIITSKYKFLFNGVDIERATTKIVVDKFRDQGISGDTIRKAVTFFLSAVKDAEIKISPHIKPVPQARTVKTNKNEKSEPKNGDAGHKGQKENGENSHSTEFGRKGTSKELPYQLIDILDDDMSEEEKDAVWTLIRYLKKKKSQSE